MVRKVVACICSSKAEIYIIFPKLAGQICIVRLHGILASFPESRQGIRRGGSDYVKRLSRNIRVLGLGTALRLALEFLHEWSLRRAVQRVDASHTNVPLGYHPAL
ncbi:hypothetical protein ACFX2G_015385 [Malus domestica]